MAKISGLERAGEDTLDGGELVPIIRHGRTFAASLADLNASAARGSEAAQRGAIEARIDSELARDIALSKGVHYPTIAAGEAATEADDLFAVYSEDGKVIYHRRTVSASYPVWEQLREANVPPAMTLAALKAGQKEIAANVQSFWTSGRDVAGIGAALWVADRLATADRAAKHPRFCMLLGLRYYRLLPINNEMTSDQAGIPPDYSDDESDAPFDPAKNAQPATQAAVDYLESLTQGTEWWTLRMVQSRFAFWATPRAGSVFDHGNVNDTGHRLVIGRQGGRILVEGLPNNGTTYVERGPTGRRPETDFAMVGGECWRGFFALLVCKQARASDPKPAMIFNSFVLKRGTMPTTNVNWPADPDGSGWDSASHHAFSVVPDNHGGDLGIYGDIHGSRGEPWYSSNAPGTKLVVRARCFDCVAMPATNYTDCDVVSYHWNCSYGYEGRLTGGKVEVECWYCPPMDGYNGKSGYGGHGGAFFTDMLMNTSDHPIAFKQVKVRAKFVACGAVDVGFGVSGDFEMWDTGLFMPVYNDAAAHLSGSTYLNIHAIRAGIRNQGLVPFSCYGPAPGRRVANDMTINIQLDATYDARASGSRFLAPVVFGGAFGENVNVHLKNVNNITCQRPANIASSARDYAPIVHQDEPAGTYDLGDNFDLLADGAELRFNYFQAVSRSGDYVSGPRYLRIKMPAPGNTKSVIPQDTLSMWIQAGGTVIAVGSEGSNVRNGLRFLAPGAQGKQRFQGAWWTPSEGAWERPGKLDFNLTCGDQVLANGLIDIAIPSERCIPVAVEARLAGKHYGEPVRIDIRDSAGNSIFEPAGQLVIANDNDRSTNAYVLKDMFLYEGDAVRAVVLDAAGNTTSRNLTVQLIYAPRGH